MCFILEGYQENMNGSQDLKETKNLHKGQFGTKLLTERHAVFFLSFFFLFFFSPFLDIKCAFFLLY